MGGVRAYFVRGDGMQDAIQYVDNIYAFAALIVVLTAGLVRLFVSKEKLWARLLTLGLFLVFCLLLALLAFSRQETTQPTEAAPTTTQAPQGSQAPRTVTSITVLDSPARETSIYGWHNLLARDASARGWIVKLEILARDPDVYVGRQLPRLLVVHGSAWAPGRGAETSLPDLGNLLYEMFMQDPAQKVLVYSRSFRHAGAVPAWRCALKAYWQTEKSVTAERATNWSKNVFARYLPSATAGEGSVAQAEFPDEYQSAMRSLVLEIVEEDSQEPEPHCAVL